MDITYCDRCSKKCRNYNYATVNDDSDYDIPRSWEHDEELEPYNYHLNVTLCENCYRQFLTLARGSKTRLFDFFGIH